ncbi:MAG TPA: (2Fe-2S)-binding protein [Burkholderiales bacterium]|nr:(2Fe-2S)-binding protein [Burkholderiales bacterium]
MFKRLPPDAAQAPSPAADGLVTITIDGEPHPARATDSVAAAMLAAGVDRCRTTPVSGAPRAPYCMMGVCFDCLVTIDGVGNRQGCLVRVRDGMKIEMQRGKRDIDT